MTPGLLQAIGQCRFCPMCRPANEVANTTRVETSSTRSRATLLWRVASGMTTWTPRAVDVVYGSTLDGISRAWCVDDAPVDDYLRAARAEIFEAGLAPAAVGDAVTQGVGPFPSTQSHDVLLLGGELALLPDAAGRAEIALGALRAAGHQDVGAAVVPSGAVPYVLGAVDAATAQARCVAEGIAASGARVVVADGPETYWMLTRVYSDLGVTAPAEVSWLSAALADGGAPVPPPDGGALWFQDARAAAAVADARASSAAILPEFRGPEEVQGRGEIYEAPRRVLAGRHRVSTEWNRSLARSSGADDGLWLTYPELAGRLADDLLERIAETAADYVVTDSPTAARHLGSRPGAQRLSGVWWLPELVHERGARR